MYSFNRILCPTDFSEASLSAIRYATFLSRQTQGHLKLLYVDEFEKEPLGFYVRDERVREEHRARVQSFTDERFRLVMDHLELPTARISMLIRGGTSYEEIIHEAEENRYSAVVISTVGLGQCSPHLLGRTAERVVRLCRAPVITLRPREATSPWKVDTILCPTDFSEYANYAIPYAASLARRYKAKIILLHTTDLTVQHPELLLEKFPALGDYHEHGDTIPVEKLVGRDVEPENSIVRIAEENQVDLIVMGTHGARGMRRVQIGNTTEEVVRRTSVPVLTVTHPIHKTIFPKRFVDDRGA